MIFLSYYFPNVDPIYLFKRAGTEDDPFLFLIDKGHVSKGFYVLKEIPSYKFGVKVFYNGQEMQEVASDEILENQYRVDYSVGVLYFHESMNGKEVTAEYYGMGFVNIPTHRIRMPGGEDDPVETLQDALNRVDDAINVLGEVGELSFKGEFNPTEEYKKWNFVTYNGKTYVAIRNSVGIEPTNREYWRLVSSGVGFAGIFDEEKSYSINDIVTDTQKKNMYISKIDNNTSPLSDSNHWELILTLDDTVDNMVAIIDQKIAELNSFKQQLIDADRQRDLNEEERNATLNDALAQLQLFKEDLIEDENERKSNEALRKSAELLRVQSEQTRINNESERIQNESIRNMQEQTREQLFASMMNSNQEALDSIDNSLQKVDNALNSVAQLESQVQLISDNAQLTLNQIDNFEHYGEYNEDIEYKKNNIVTYNGSSYIAIQNSKGIPITNSDYWKPLALKGKDGTEITIEGIGADENNNISLEALGLIRAEEVYQISESLENDYNTKIGNLSDLRTSSKGSIVEAINELKSRIDSLIDIVT